MTLTLGTGPFSERSAGTFNVTPPTRPLLFWEPFPKRLRVKAGGETIVDSRRVVALYETGKSMRLCAPRSDVRIDLLAPGTRSGDTRAWSLKPDEGRAAPLAFSFEEPPPAASALKDLFVFRLENADAWYLEDDLGYAHPRDPYHRVDVHRSSRRVVVYADQTKIAETSAPCVLFETSLSPRFYLPPDAVRTDLLVKSETVSQCPYKGDGQHWHVMAGERRIANAAWSLTTPMGDALMIPRWFSFYTEKLRVEVDGEPLQN